ETTPSTACVDVLSTSRQSSPGHGRQPTAVVDEYGFPLACWQPSGFGPPSPPAWTQNRLQVGWFGVDDGLAAVGCEPPPQAVSSSAPAAATAPITAPRRRSGGRCAEHLSRSAPRSYGDLRAEAVGLRLLQLRH